MKKLFVTLAFVLSALHTVIAQQFFDGPASDKISPFTAFLLADLTISEQKPEVINTVDLIKKYKLISKGNTLYANSFIKTKSEFDLSQLRHYGVLPGSRSGNISTALIPVQQIRNVAGNKDVLYVAIGQPATLFMDSARRQTNVDKVQQGMAPLAMPYKGDGVVVADIDVGFDYTHPNFYDSTGSNNYRIKRVWEMMNNNGTPPAGFSMGRELVTQTELLNAGTSDSNESHGSHVLGISGGSGGFPGSPYAGVAPHADLVMIAPTNGGLTDANVADGISYVQSYAASVGKPSVINMSFGSQAGPHDGNSIFDQFLANKTSPGNLLVSAAGNDGRNKIHVAHNFTTTDTLIKTAAIFNACPTGNYGLGFADIWGNAGSNYKVAVYLFNVTTGVWEDSTVFYSANLTHTIFDTLVGIDNVPAYLKIGTGIQASVGNKPECHIEIEDTLQTTGDRFLLVQISSTNAQVDMWGYQQYMSFSNLGMPIPFVSGSNSGSVADMGGTSQSTICVGAYTSKNSWTATNSNNYYTSSPIFSIASFSSRGPSSDGRTKPEITAPGSVIASSWNSFETITDSTAMIHKITGSSRDWYFCLDQGTSMAAPMVTGIVALWLQKNPTLDLAQALALMKSSALTDTATGTIPAGGSNTWGWGKINAFAGLIALDVKELTNTMDAEAYPNPATSEINVQFHQPVRSATLQLYDMSGKLLVQQQMSAVQKDQTMKINMIPLSYGAYMLHITSEKGTTQFKILKQ